MKAERLTEASDAELDALSDLCMRSKAFWGYDTTFMDACRDVLRVRREDLVHPTAVVRDGASFAGLTRVNLSAPDPEVSKLFVCPDHMGQGVGTALMAWAKDEARKAGCAALQIESDPGAAPFYARHGAVQIGEVPSEVIPGRRLPLLKMPTGAAT